MYQNYDVKVLTWPGIMMCSDLRRNSGRSPWNGLTDVGNMFPASVTLINPNPGVPGVFTRTLLLTSSSNVLMIFLIICGCPIQALDLSSFDSVEFHMRGSRLTYLRL